MKYLTNYIEEGQTKIFEKYGVFFAFSNKQYNEKAKPELEPYVHVGHGMIVPKPHVKDVLKALDDVHEAGIKQDLQENTKEGVIKRELGNHECYYTGDIEPAVDCLSSYGITAEEVQKVFSATWAEACKEF